MSLLISIFGGMLLTAVLYYAGLRGRLSNYWAAVIAAAIPTLAYLAHVVRHPVGLDTVTMHIIAYPTVAVLLSLPNNAKGKKSGGAMHWVPKLLIAFFLFLMLIMAGFVYIAGQGLPPAITQRVLPDAKGRNIHTGFAGVVEHKQDAAKGIGQHLKMEHRLAELGWQVEVIGLTDLPANQPAPLRVRILDTESKLVESVAVALEFGRPGQKASQRIDLSGSPDGYHGVLAGLDSGTWVAILHLNQGGEKLVALEHALEVR
jgi:hypothetical protein